MIFGNIDWYAVIGGTFGRWIDSFARFDWWIYIRVKCIVEEDVILLCC